MTPCLDTWPRTLKAAAPPPLPVEALVLGKPVEEVAELLPRLFNLCRTTQAMAIRLALGLPGPGLAELAREIRAEHMLRLCVMLPARLGLATLDPKASLPFGDKGFPKTAEAFGAFVAECQGIATVFAEVMERFGPGEGCAQPLPPVLDAAILSRDALENSAAARHLGHPVMRHVEAQWGRGPLWRLVARALDLEAAAEERIPTPRLVAEGFAIVPSARGLYAVRARAEGGRVSSLERVTPTDHLLSPGGIMDQSLASLPPAKHDLAGLLVEVLDPCVPVTVEGLHDA